MKAHEAARQSQPQEPTTAERRIRADVFKTFLQVTPQLIASIFIPLTVAGVGWYYTRWQQNVSDLKTMIDLVTETDKEKRKYGIAMFEYLLKNDKVPVEFVYAQINFANASSDRDLLPMFEVAIQNAGAENPRVLQTYADALKRLPSRVFVHVQNEQQKRCIASLLETLKDTDKAQFNVSGVYVVSNYQNPVHELRFLKPQDEERARQFGGLLQGLGITTEVKDLTAWGATARFVRPNTFELWFGAPIGVACGG